MKIRLIDFKEGVLTQVHGQYHPAELDLEFVDLKYLEPLFLDGTIDKGHDTLTFRGHLRSRLVHICGRCLKQVEDRIDLPFEFFYETKGKEVIETIDELREIVILDHPISFLCREDCRGLCPRCGTNLNEGRCRCRTQEGETVTPLAFLKQMWVEKKKERSHGQS